MGATSSRNRCNSRSSGNTGWCANGYSLGLGERIRDSATNNDDNYDNDDNNNNHHHFNYLHHHNHDNGANESTDNIKKRPTHNG
jgi:hypothetical protein